MEPAPTFAGFDQFEGGKKVILARNRLTVKDSAKSRQNGAKREVHEWNQSVDICGKYKYMVSRLASLKAVHSFLL